MKGGNSMTQLAKEIMEFLNTEGQRASDMTHAIKEIGDGDMKKGMKNFADFFYAEGHSTGISQGFDMGERSGITKGSVLTLLVVAVAGGSYTFLKNKHQKKQMEVAQKEKGEKILQAIERETSFSEGEEIAANLEEGINEI